MQSIIRRCWLACLSTSKYTGLRIRERTFVSGHRLTMVKEIRVNGFDEFMKTVEDQKTNTVYVLFTGSAGEDGHSWCPDCVKADPVVKECLQYADSDATFITCSVGERTYWKDQQNVFRTNSKTNLKGVPTLMAWGTQRKLDEDQCASSDLVRMFFEEA